MKNRRTMGWIALICILLAATIFYYNNVKIPGLEKKIRQKIDVTAMPKVNVAVVKENEVISKYTQLTEEIINQKIQIVEIPVDYANKRAVSDTDLIRNKIVKEDLSSGEQILEDSLSTEEKWFGDYDRLKEYVVRTVVADEVKQGNIVDILVNYGNGTYDVVVPMTKVRKIIKGIEKETSIPVYTLVFSVNEEANKDLQLASALGTLETRLYIDESQKPSQKTFNFSQMINFTTPYKPRTDVNTANQVVVPVEGQVPQGELKLAN